MREARWSGCLLAVFAACSEPERPARTESLEQAGGLGLGLPVVGVLPGLFGADSRFGHALALMPNAAIVVGAPDYRGNGAAFMFSRADPITGFTLSQIWSGHEPDAGAAQLGYALLPVPDLNSDALSELLVGAPSYNAETGAVFVYLSNQSSSAMLTPTALRLQPSNVSPYARFGHALANVGDVDGDGRADVLVGAPGANTAYVMGSNNGAYKPVALWQFLKPGTVRMGAAVAAADVNGDGRLDVVLGDPNYSSSATNQGAVVTFLRQVDGGFDTGAVTKGDGGSFFGAAVTPAGDLLGGDGREEVFVGAPGHNGTVRGEGAVFGMRGAAGGLSNLGGVFGEPADQVDAGYGFAMAYLPDLDEDSRPDLVVGAPTWGMSGALRRGAAFLHPSGNLDAGPQLIDLALSPNSEFGTAFAGGVDVDGDGARDLLIGAPRHSSAGFFEGAVFVVFGTPTTGMGGGIGGTAGGPNGTGGGGGGLTGGVGGGSGGGGGSAGGSSSGSLKVVTDALPNAIIGRPYPYNALGRVLATGGSPPYQFASCASNEPRFFVDGATGAVSWVPAGSDGQLVPLCVKVTDLSDRSAAYAFDVTLHSEPARDAGAVADFSFSPDPATFGEPVRFDASLSRSPFGIAKFKWDFGDQSMLDQGHSPQHVFRLPGGYRVQLLAFDLRGQSAGASHVVRVRDARGHLPPVVQLTAEEPTGVGAQTLKLFADLSPGDADLVDKRWDFEGGEVVADETTVSRLFAPGTHRVRFTVTDANGLQGFDSVQVVVRNENGAEAPRCRAWVDPPAGQAPLETFFSGDWNELSGGAVQASYTFPNPNVPAPAPVPANPPVRALLEEPGERTGVLTVTARALTCTDFVVARAYELPAVSGVVPPVACGDAVKAPLEVTGANEVQVTGGDGSASFDEGVLHWRPPAMAGTTVLTVEASSPYGTASHALDVTMECPPRLEFGTPACGCSGGGGAALGWLALALARRLRRQPPLSL